MLPLKKLLVWWNLEEESSGLDDWDPNDVNDPEEPTPESLTIHLVLKADPQYQLTFSISTNTWKMQGIQFWFQKSGEFGMRPLDWIRSDHEDIDAKIMEWTRNPESFRKKKSW